MKRLIIVDIQKTYKRNFSLSYLFKVYNFLRKNKDKYDEIVCLLDLPRHNVYGDLIPKFIDSFTTEKTIVKLYNQEYTLNMINSNFNIHIDIQDDKTHIMGDIKEKNGKVKKRLENGYLIGRRENDSLNIDFLDNHFSKKVLQWKDEESTIDLIGGGLNKCVAKTARILDVFNIEHKILEDYCYTIDEKKKNFLPSFMFNLSIINDNKSIIDYIEKGRTI